MAGPSAGCRGGGWPSPSWTRPWRRRWRTSGRQGVSLLLALAGTLLAALAMRDTRKLAAGAGLVATAAVLLAPALRPWDPTPNGTLRVASVQGDVPGDGTEVLADFRQVTDNHVRATVELADEVAAGERELPDFVLWPENSTAVDPFADAQTRTGIETAVAAIGVPILVGAMVDAGPDHVMNQGVVWDPVLGGGDRYTKRHPVPFGEYIPWRNVFGDSFGKLDMIPRDMLSGTRKEPCAWAAHWSRTPSASTSRTTTGSTTRSRTAPRWSSCRRATRCSSTPRRSSSSWRSPACARSSWAARSRSPR